MAVTTFLRGAPRRVTGPGFTMNPSEAALYNQRTDGDELPSRSREPESVGSGDILRNE